MVDTDWKYKTAEAAAAAAADITYYTTDNGQRTCEQDKQCISVPSLWTNEF